MSSGYSDNEWTHVEISRINIYPHLVDFGSHKLSETMEPIVACIKIENSDTIERKTVSWSVAVVGVGAANIQVSPRQGHLVWGDEDTIGLSLSPLDKAPMKFDTSSCVVVSIDGNEHSRLPISGELYVPYLSCVDVSEIRFPPASLGQSVSQVFPVVNMGFESETLVSVQFVPDIEFCSKGPWKGGVTIDFIDKKDTVDAHTKSVLARVSYKSPVRASIRGKVVVSAGDMAYRTIPLMAVSDDSVFTLQSRLGDISCKDFGPSHILTSCLRSILALPEYDIQWMLSNDDHLVLVVGKLIELISGKRIKKVTSLGIHEFVLKYLLRHEGVIGGITIEHLAKCDLLSWAEVMYQFLKIFFARKCTDGNGLNLEARVDGVVSRVKARLGFLDAFKPDVVEMARQRVLFSLAAELGLLDEDFPIGDSSGRDLALLCLTTELVAEGVASSLETIAFGTSLGKTTTVLDLKSVTELGGNQQSSPPRIYSLRSTEYTVNPIDQCVNHTCKFRTPVDAFVLGNRRLYRLCPEVGGMEPVKSVPVEGTVLIPSLVSFLVQCPFEKNFEGEKIFHITCLGKDSPLIAKKDAIVFGNTYEGRAEFTLLGFLPVASTYYVLFSNKQIGEFCVALLVTVNGAPEPEVPSLELVARVGKGDRGSITTTAVNYTYEAALRIARSCVVWKDKKFPENNNYFVSSSNPGVFAVVGPPVLDSCGIALSVIFSPTAVGPISGLITLHDGGANVRRFKVTGVGLEPVKIFARTLETHARNCVACDVDVHSFVERYAEGEGSLSLSQSGESKCSSWLEFPSAVKLSPESRTVIPFTFSPHWICESEVLIVELSLVDKSNRILDSAEIHLTLVAMRPLVSSVLRVTAHTREQTRIEVEIPNWLRGPQTVGNFGDPTADPTTDHPSDVNLTVSSNVPSCVYGAPTVATSIHSATIQYACTGMSLIAQKICGILSFSDPLSGEFMEVGLEVNFEDIATPATTAVQCKVRETVLLDIDLEWPVTDSSVVPSIEGGCISFLSSELKKFTFEYLSIRPAVNELACVRFSHPEFGERSHRFLLNAADPDEVDLGTIECELGRSVRIPFNIANPMRKGCVCPTVDEAVANNSDLTVQLPDSIPPLDTRTGYVTYTPSVIETNKRRSILVTDAHCGEWKFRISTSCCRPRAPIVCEINTDGVALIRFRNPFSETHMFTLTCEEGSTQMLSAIDFSGQSAATPNVFVLKPNEEVLLPLRIERDVSYHPVQVVSAIDSNILWRYIIMDPVRSVPVVSIQTRAWVPHYSEHWIELKDAASLDQLTTATFVNSQNLSIQHLVDAASLSARIVEKKDSDGAVRILLGISFNPEQQLSSLAYVVVNTSSCPIPILLKSVPPHVQDVIVMDELRIDLNLPCNSFEARLIQKSNIFCLSQNGGSLSLTRKPTTSKRSDNAILQLETGFQTRRILIVTKSL